MFGLTAPAGDCSGNGKGNYNSVLGVFPMALFGNGQLSRNPTRIDAGGEMAADTTVSAPKAGPIGDGRNEGGYAVFVYYDASGEHNSNLKPDYDRPCYKASDQKVSGSYVYFQFGGPGGNLAPKIPSTKKFICQRARS